MELAFSGPRFAREALAHRRQPRSQHRAVTSSQSILALSRTIISLSDWRNTLMSLNWSVTRIKLHDTACFVIATEDRPMEGVAKGNRLLSPVTHALIWATMAVDLGGITKKNVLEFWGRVSIVQAYTPLMNHWVDGKVVPRLLTLEEVEAHIGLSTNVTNRTRTQWNKRFMERRWHEVEGR